MKKQKLMKTLAVSTGIGLIASSVIIPAVVNNTQVDNTQKVPTPINTASSLKTSNYNLVQAINDTNHNLTIPHSLSPLLLSTAINSTHLKQTQQTITTLITNHLLKSDLIGFNPLLLQLTNYHLDSLSNTLLIQATYDYHPLNNWIIHGWNNLASVASEFDAILSTHLNPTLPTTFTKMLSSVALNSTNYATTYRTIFTAISTELKSNVNFNAQHLKLTLSAGDGFIHVGIHYLNQVLTPLTFHGCSSTNSLIHAINTKIMQGFAANTQLKMLLPTQADNTASFKHAVLTFLTTQCVSIKEVNTQAFKIDKTVANKNTGTITVYTTYNNLPLSPFIVKNFQTVKGIVKNFNFNFNVGRISPIGQYWSYIVANAFNNNFNSTILSPFKNVAMLSKTNLEAFVSHIFLTNQPNVANVDMQEFSFQHAYMVSQGSSILVMNVTYESYSLPPIRLNGFVSTNTLMYAASIVFNNINTALNTVLVPNVSINQLTGLNNLLVSILANTHNVYAQMLKTNLVFNAPLNLVNRVNNTNSITCYWRYNNNLFLPLTFTGFNSSATISQVASSIAQQLNTNLKLNLNFTTNELPVLLNNVKNAILSNVLSQLKVNTALTLKIKQTNGFSTITLSKNDLLQDFSIQLVPNSTNLLNGTAQFNLLFNNDSNNPLITNNTTMNVATLKVSGFYTPNMVLSAITTALNNTVNLQNNFYPNSSVFLLSKDSTYFNEIGESAWASFTNSYSTNSSQPSWIDNSAYWTKHWNDLNQLTINSYNQYMHTFLANTFKSDSTGLNVINANGKAVYFNLKALSFSYEYSGSTAIGTSITQNLTNPLTDGKSLFGVKFTLDGTSSGNLPFSGYKSNNLYPSFSDVYNSDGNPGTFNGTNAQLNNMLKTIQPYLQQTINWNNPELNATLDPIFTDNNYDDFTNLSAQEFANYLNIAQQNYSQGPAINNGYNYASDDTTFNNVCNMVWKLNNNIVANYVNANVLVMPNGATTYAYNVVENNGYKQVAMYNPLDNAASTTGVQSYTAPFSGYFWPSVDTALNGNGFVNGVNALTGEVAITMQFGSEASSILPVNIYPVGGAKYFIVKGLAPQQININTTGLTVNSQNSALNNVWLKNEQVDTALSSNQLATTDAIIKKMIIANNTNNSMLSWINWNDLKLGTITGNNKTGVLTVAHATYNGQVLPSFNITGLFTLQQEANTVQAKLNNPIEIAALSAYTPYSMTLNNTNQTNVLKIVQNTLKTIDPLLTNPADLVFSGVNFNTNALTLTFNQAIGGQTFTFHTTIKGFTSQSVALNNFVNEANNIMRKGLNIDGNVQVGHRHFGMWLGNLFGANQGIYNNANTWSSVNSFKLLPSNDMTNFINQQLQTAFFNNLSNTYGYGNLLQTTALLVSFSNTSNTTTALNNGVFQVQNLQINFNFMNLQPKVASGQWNMSTNGAIQQQMFTYTLITDSNVDQFVPSDASNTLKTEMLGTYAQTGLADYVPVGKVTTKSTSNQTSYVAITNIQNAKFSIPTIYNNRVVSYVAGCGIQLMSYLSSMQEFNLSWGNNISSFTLPISTVVVGKTAFEEYGGYGLTLPNSITAIENGAFELTNSLGPNLTLPNNLTYLGPNAFYDDTKLTGVLTINPMLTSISSYAFNSDPFSNVVWNTHLTTIGNSAFDYALKTKQLVLPNSITTIGDFAFANTTITNKSIVIPANIQKIGAFAFYQSSLTNFTFKNTTTLQVQADLNSTNTSNDGMPSTTAPYVAFSSLNQTTQQETFFWMVASTYYTTSLTNYNDQYTTCTIGDLNIGSATAGLTPNAKVDYSFNTPTATYTLTNITVNSMTSNFNLTWADYNSLKLTWTTKNN